MIYILHRLFKIYHPVTKEILQNIRNKYDKDAKSLIGFSMMISQIAEKSSYNFCGKDGKLIINKNNDEVNDIDDPDKKEMKKYINQYLKAEGLAMEILEHLNKNEIYPDIKSIVSLVPEEIDREIIIRFLGFCKTIHDVNFFSTFLNYKIKNEDIKGLFDNIEKNIKGKYKYVSDVSGVCCLVPADERIEDDFSYFKVSSHLNTDTLLKDFLIKHDIGRGTDIDNQKLFDILEKPYVFDNKNAQSTQ